MKKLISLVVLTSMLLYGLGRIGLISYVYENRHEFAYSLGLTAEKVIAVCKGDYFQQAKLNPEQADERSLPAGFTEVQDIVLGCPSAVQSPPVLTFGSIDMSFAIYCEKEYPAPYSDIFHPPGNLS